MEQLNESENFEVLFKLQGKDFSESVGKHYTSIGRLINGEDDFDYKSVEIIAKRQFTGLKDRNGIKIYNDDLIKILFTDWHSQSQPEKLSLEDYKDSLTKIFVVVFYQGAFQIRYSSRYYPGDFEYDDIICGKHGYIEVIGNTHENTELLSLLS
jgi:uncharacterized phage protein (TIGR01671 family)